MNFFESIETDRSLTFKERYLKKRLKHDIRKNRKGPDSSLDLSGWQFIQFDSPSGGTISAMHASALSEAKGSIICAPPLHLTGKFYFLEMGFTRLLRQQGYNLLLFDFNGFGESSAGNFDYPSDVTTTAKTARVIFDTDTIGFWGIGFGATWGLSALKHSHPINTGLFDSPFLNFSHCVAQHTESWLTRWLTKGVTFPNPVLDFLEATSIEDLLFLFEGKASQLPYAGKKYYEICRTNWKTETDDLPWLDWPAASYQFNRFSNRSSKNYLETILGHFDRYFNMSSISMMENGHNVKSHQRTSA